MSINAKYLRDQDRRQFALELDHVCDVIREVPTEISQGEYGPPTPVTVYAAQPCQFWTEAATREANSVVGSVVIQETRCELVRPVGDASWQLDSGDVLAHIRWPDGELLDPSDPTWAIAGLTVTDVLVIAILRRTGIGQPDAF